MSLPKSADIASRRRATVACGLVALLAASTSVAAAAVTVLQDEGEARDPGTGELLYREQHLRRLNDGDIQARLVLYRCVDGSAFARKQVDYRHSMTAPTFALEDARNGYREGLRRESVADDGEPRDERVTLWNQSSRTEPERSAVLKQPALIADAGFDEFIRARWDELAAGESVRLRFAVPARLDSFAFELRKVSERPLYGQPALTLRLSLGSWLRWLAPAIDVSYTQADRRLLRFEGVSNLRSDDGREQLKVRIDFPKPATAGTDALWRRWQAVELKPCQPTRKTPAMQARPA